MGGATWLLVAVVAMAAHVSAYSSYEQSHCADMQPQNGLDMDQLMGMWYGVEIISHYTRDGDDVMVFSTCPILHLTETSYEQTRGVYSRDDYYTGMTSTESYIRPGSYGYRWTGDRYSNTHRERDYRHLRLYWSENGNNVEYYLKFNNTRKGFWVSTGPQNAGPVLQPQYNQFNGVVQVMKAVVDHLVLTFCQKLPETQLFTVILSREPLQLSRLELYSIHGLLNRKDLSTSSIRKVCSGANGERASYLSVILFAITSSIIYLKSV